MPNACGLGTERLHSFFVFAREVCGGMHTGRQATCEVRGGGAPNKNLTLARLFNFSLQKVRQMKALTELALDLLCLNSESDFALSKLAQSESAALIEAQRHRLTLGGV